MLLELTIKDFAIIDHLNLRLNRQFNVFTGETGAGKSIIIDAVTALLGAKIGVEFVRAGCERASVEGVFSIEALPPISDTLPSVEAMPEVATHGTSTLLDLIEHVEHCFPQHHSETSSADARVALATLLHQYDIEPEDGQLILSRDIFRSGRTVARINGRAFSQQVLQQVANWLIDIHGQSEHFSLLRTEQHINFLDRYAETLPLRERLSQKVHTWRNARKTLQLLQRNIHEQERRAEFLRYEIDEIEKADLRSGEEAELVEEQKLLSNAERLRELCTLIYTSIKGSDLADDDFKPALDQLSSAQRSLNELVRLDTHMTEYAEMLAEAIYQLEDVASSISSYGADIEDNPRRLAEIQERLDLLSKLKRKYGATVEKILKHAAADQAELDRIINQDAMISKLQRQDGQLRREIGVLAQKLSQRRYEAAQRLARAMEEQLNDLNMRRARFQIHIEQVTDEQGVPASIKGHPQEAYACDLTGIDRVQFLIAPNPGEPFKPLTKIASGGETSRLMLALKTILTGADATPTLIFDEIDAGISGHSGQIVGEKLWQLTRDHQVICVTHLPQIASFADTHYHVNKQIFDNRTVTIVNELRPEQRACELAHIMGGNITELSTKSAQEMLDRTYLWKEHWTRGLVSQHTA